MMNQNGTSSNKIWRPEPQIGIKTDDCNHDVGESPVKRPRRIKPHSGVLLPADDGKVVAIIGNRNGTMRSVLAWAMGIPAAIIIVGFLARGR